MDFRAEIFRLFSGSEFHGDGVATLVSTKPTHFMILLAEQVPRFVRCIRN